MWKRMTEPLVGAAVFCLGALLLLHNAAIVIDTELIIGVVTVSVGVAIWVAAGGK